MTALDWAELPDDAATVTVDLPEVLARTPSVTARRVETHRTRLGEHPVAVDEQTVVWVDIDAGEVRRTDVTTGATHVLHRDARPVGFALPVAGRPDLWWLGVGDELGRLNTSASPGEGLRSWGRVPGSRPGMRLNDAAVSPAGTVWLGLMDAEEQPHPRGLIARAVPAGGSAAFVTELAAMGCPNGIGWSPDARTVLVVETETRVVASARYDLSTDAPRDWRLAARFVGSEAYPDGLLWDGPHIWIAFWGEGAVIRFDRDFTAELVVRVDDPHATSVDRHGSRLFVTAASGLYVAEL